MINYKILLQGYANFISKKLWKVNPTVVLIENRGEYIIFDPGVDRKPLLNALDKESLTVKDINYVFISHKHIDHIALAGIFPNAKLCTGKTIYEGAKEIKHNGNIFGNDIKTISTPGHTKNHNSLLFTVHNQKILLAGDVFWWHTKEKQAIDYKSLINKNDIFAENQKQLEDSRKKALKLADIIIPGHGKIFKNPGV